MRKNRLFLAKDVAGTLSLAGAALLLILDGATATEGMVHGLLLCLQTVIPALFPLMVLARLIMRSSLPHSLGKPLGALMGSVFHQPPQAAICLVLGLIGGYPLGAQAVGLAYNEKLLTRGQAEHLLTFCNNAGPAFLFGIVGASLGGPAVAATLYGIHILSALLTGFLLRPRSSATISTPVPCYRPSKITEPILLPAIKAMATVAAYVTLFQVAGAFLDKYLAPWLPQVFGIAASGLLELSGGCLRLRELGSLGWQYCMVSGFLGMGGLCVWLQTKTVLRTYHLRGQSYFPGKVLHGTIAVLMTWCCMIFFPELLPRSLPAVYLPNHQGLLSTTGWVFLTFFILIGLWCLLLRKKAGKEEEYGV